MKIKIENIREELEKRILSLMQEVDEAYEQGLREGFIRSKIEKGDDKNEKI